MSMTCQIFCLQLNYDGLIPTPLPQDRKTRLFNSSMTAAFLYAMADKCHDILFFLESNVLKSKNLYGNKIKSEVFEAQVCLYSRLLYGTYLNFTTMHKCQFFYLRLNHAKPYPPTPAPQGLKIRVIDTSRRALYFFMWWQMNIKTSFSSQRKMCWKVRTLYLRFCLIYSLIDNTCLIFTTMHKCQFFYLRLNCAKSYPPTPVPRGWKDRTIYIHKNTMLLLVNGWKDIFFAFEVEA